MATQASQCSIRAITPRPLDALIQCIYRIFPHTVSSGFLGRGVTVFVELEGFPMVGDDDATISSSTHSALEAVSQHAVRSFPTLQEAIDATLTLIGNLLDMEVLMVNRVEADRHTFTRLHLPPDMPNLEGMSSPLSHNF